MLPNDFKPYLIRSFYEYLIDKGLTPYVHVFVNELTEVPSEFVSDDAITLNIGQTACSAMEINHQKIHFEASFSGQIRYISIPMGHVLSIYARENTDLMLTFSLEKYTKTSVSDSYKDSQSTTKQGASHLKVVKKKR